MSITANCFSQNKYKVINGTQPDYIQQYNTMYIMYKCNDELEQRHPKDTMPLHKPRCDQLSLILLNILPDICCVDIQTSYLQSVEPVQFAGVHYVELYQRHTLARAFYVVCNSYNKQHTFQVAHHLSHTQKHFQKEHLNIQQLCSGHFFSCHMLCAIT